MPFFARPDLSNEQFKQLSGSTLTLSGTTQIANPVGGLEFIDELGRPIPVILTGASNQEVLTYISGSSGICLTLTTPTCGTSTGVYPYNESSTCTVGGLPAGSCLFNETIADILHDILVPTLSPTKVEPAHTFSLSCCPAAYCSCYYEINTTICVTGNSTFSRGSVSPVYCSGPSVRSGFPSAYCYTTSYGGACPAVSCTGLTNPYIFTSHSIVDNETYCGRVFYGSGQTILNSGGGTAVFTTPYTANPLLACCTSNITRTICATYPYFYGKLTGSTRPAVTNALVISGDKVICPSTGTITVSFNSNTNEYTWLAIPTICGTTKKCWFVNALDNGFMNRGCISDKYPDECIISITCGWTQNYMVYMSGTVGQITNPMEFRNS